MEKIFRKRNFEITKVLSGDNCEDTLSDIMSEVQ